VSGPEAAVGGSENTLVDQARHGLKPAFEQLHRLYRREILGYLCARYAGKEDAEDIAQEAWIAVYSKLDQFDPARGNFEAFAKYWAGITALRWRHKNLPQQTLLLAELASKFPDSLREADIDEIAKTVRQQALDPEQMYAKHQRYSTLLQTTFATASPPHQLLAFAFCKLLDWRPRRFVKDMSDLFLAQLEGQFEKAYIAEIPAEADLVKKALASLRNTLGLTFGEAVKDPVTLGTYPELVSRQVGMTKLRDYYRDQPEQNVSHWIYAVRRRALVALGGSGDRPGR
jgi:RNA polymerase sigma factor (sigma-70 family)